MRMDDFETPSLRSHVIWCTHMWTDQWRKRNMRLFILLTVSIFSSWRSWSAAEIRCSSDLHIMCIYIPACSVCIHCIIYKDMLVCTCISSRCKLSDASSERLHLDLNINRLRICGQRWKGQGHRDLTWPQNQQFNSECQTSGGWSSAMTFDIP